MLALSPELPAQHLSSTRNEYPRCTGRPSKHHMREAGIQAGYLSYHHGIRSVGGSRFQPSALASVLCGPVYAAYDTLLGCQVPILRCIAYDIRGYGRSPNPTGDSMTFLIADLEPRCSQSLTAWWLRASGVCNRSQDIGWSSRSPSRRPLFFRKYSGSNTTSLVKQCLRKRSWPTSV